MRPLPRSHVLLALAVAPLLSAATCQSRPSPKDQEAARIHYDLGIQAQQGGDARLAAEEYQKALELDPDLDLANNAIAILEHLVFKLPEKAIAHYKHALELNPKLSEVYTNLGNVYLDLGRYDEAIPLYEKSLSDILYKTPYIAENNLGWALYKKGNREQGIRHIKSALAVNANFCLGHKNLGIIFLDASDYEHAVQSFERYAKSCPKVADAHYQLGLTFTRSGDTARAKASFEKCQANASGAEIGDECRRLSELLK